MRKILILMAILMVTGLVAGQSVGFTESSDIPEEFTGGESFDVSVTVENDASDNLPLFFELNADYAGEEENMSSNTRIQAFDIDVNEESLDEEYEGVECTELSSNGESVYTSPVPVDEEQLREVEEVPFGFQRDFCAFPNVSQGEHSFEFEVSTNPRLRPGSYDLGIDLETVSSIDLEVPEEFDEYGKGLNPSNNELSDGDVDVEFDTEDLPPEPDEEEETQLEEFSSPVRGDIAELDSVNVEDTPGQFVRGLHVNVIDRAPFVARTDEEGSEFRDSDDVLFTENYDIGGNITIGFDGDEVGGLEDLSIHRLEDASEGEWQEIDTDISDGEAFAQVDQFSTYVLYGQEEDPEAEPTTSSGGGSSFSADVDFTVQTEGLTVSLDDETNTYDREAESYDWEFGDGETGSGETVDHTFDEPGEYDVTLTVTDDEGDEHSMTQTVEVEEAETDEESEPEPENDEEETQEEEESTPDTGPPTDTPAQAQGLTGQFTEAASNPVTVLAGLLVLLAGYAVYRGRHEAVLQKVKALRP